MEGINRLFKGKYSNDCNLKECLLAKKYVAQYYNVDIALQRFSEKLKYSWFGDISRTIICTYGGKSESYIMLEETYDIYKFFTGEYGESEFLYLVLNAFCIKNSGYHQIDLITDLCNNFTFPYFDKEKKVLIKKSFSYTKIEMQLILNAYDENKNIVHLSDRIILLPSSIN
jgi:hypothetical protein